ncbi:MAG: hypothetical protein JXN65_02705 [Clostridia bacterium]|nr:hypothetical protein [Clostridia bacterium]
MNLIEWFNQNQGFVMAFLTLIYVTATVLILISNSKSTRIMQQNLLLTDKIQKENAKLALHTKRLEAFDKLNQLVIKIYEEGPKSDYITELLKTCTNVYYLFDDEIDIRVKKIVFDIQRLRRIEYKARSFAQTKKEKQSLDEHKKALHENLLESLKELTEQVTSYLDIGDSGLDDEEDDEKEDDTAEDKD